MQGFIDSAVDEHIKTSSPTKTGMKTWVSTMALRIDCEEQSNA